MCYFLINSVLVLSLKACQSFSYLLDNNLWTIRKYKECLCPSYLNDLCLCMFGPKSLRRCGTACSDKTVGFSVQGRGGQLAADYTATYTRKVMTVWGFSTRSCLYERDTTCLKCFVLKTPVSQRYNHTAAVKPLYLQLMRDWGSHKIQTPML